MTTNEPVWSLPRVVSDEQQARAKFDIAEYARKLASVDARKYDAELMGRWIDHAVDALAYRSSMNKTQTKTSRWKRKIAAISMLNARTWHGTHRLVLHAGLNVVVGPSDSGKSNLVRNILSVAENCPADALMTREMDQANVVIEFNDAHTVGLFKSSKRNEYATNDGRAGNPQSYTSVGMAVPEPVARELALGSVEMGGEPVVLNIQTQRGPVLLIDDAPARVARIVGSVSGLDVIHKAVAASAKAKREAEQAGQVARKAARSAAEDWRAARDGLDVDKATAALRTAEEADSARLAALSRVSELEAGLGRVQEARTAYRAAKRVQEGAEVAGYKVRSLFGKLSAARDRLAALEAAREAVQATRTAYGEAKARQAAAWDARAETQAELEQFRNGLEVCPVCEQAWDHDHASNDPNESRGVL